MTDTDPLTSAQRTWQATLDELKLQMTRATFDTWLRGTQVVAVDGDHWTILCRHVHAVDWLQNRLLRLVERTLQRRIKGQAQITFVAPEPAPAPVEGQAPAAPDTQAQDTEPADTQPRQPTSAQAAPASHEAVVQVAQFDPASAGWWQAGQYAVWYWAALLGPVAWRIYEMIMSDYKVSPKAPWTPPRRYSISELARAIASGRRGRGNRNQITGRWRTSPITGERTWSVGAFDVLAYHRVGRIDWHDGDSDTWQQWSVGGSERAGRSGLRIVYRASVLTSLPILTPHQVKMLAADHQVSHERYLVDRGIDIAAWDAIKTRTLAEFDCENIHPTAAYAALTAAQGAMNEHDRLFFPMSTDA